MKRIITYILILALMMGTFGFALQAKAADCTGNGRDAPDCTPTSTTNGNCFYAPGADTTKPTEASNYPCTNPVEAAGSAASTTSSSAPSALKDSLESCVSLNGGLSVAGCVEGVTYIVFITIPSFLLGLAAKMFDFMAALTLSSEMYRLPFVQNIWTVVRDFANIFFILILLYAAFEIILDLGHGSAKKIVASVILIALVVNFSLFFTKIVIDSSNITALIFYNRIDTSNIAPDNIGDSSKTGVPEKPMAAALVSRFNINEFFNGDLLNSMKTINISYFNLQSIITQVPKVSVGVDAVPLISMMVAYGLVIYALVYAFFIVGLTFLSRMITLMMLMIVSPFAFVTSAVPTFKHINTIGFDSWLKKLIETSFVAAVFMFILYIISEILREKIFDSVASAGNTGIIATLLKIFIPAILIVILLLKGTKYAKSASGEFTDSVIKGAQVVGGLAVGVATGGAAVAGRATIGRGLSAAANSKWMKEREARGGFLSTASRDLFKAAGSGSFDLRGVKIAGKSLASTGFKVGEAQKGGFAERRAEQVKKRQARAQELEVGEDEPLKQALNKTEGDYQNLLNANSKELSELDLLITKKREALRDTTARFGGGSKEAKSAGLELQNVKDRKKALKDGIQYAGDKDLNGQTTGVNAKDYRGVNAGFYTDRQGNVRIRTINFLEDEELRDKKQDIEDENRRRGHNYAHAIQSPIEDAKQFLLTGGSYTPATAQEAAHKIIMHAKLDSGDKAH